MTLPYTPIRHARLSDEEVHEKAQRLSLHYTTHRFSPADQRRIASALLSILTPKEDGDTPTKPKTETVINWQPWSTAPKSGTMLVYVPGDGIFEAFYGSQDCAPEHSRTLEAADPSGGGYYPLLDTPSHWAPCPAPPDE